MMSLGWFSTKMLCLVDSCWDANENFKQTHRFYLQDFCRTLLSSDLRENQQNLWMRKKSTELFINYIMSFFRYTMPMRNFKRRRNKKENFKCFVQNHQRSWNSTQRVSMASCFRCSCIYKPCGQQKFRKWSKF